MLEIHSTCDSFTANLVNIAYIVFADCFSEVVINKKYNNVLVFAVELHTTNLQLKKYID